MNSRLLFQQRVSGLRVCALLMVLLTVSLTTEAQIRYVKPGGSGNGTSWNNASGDLQAMINASSSGQQVWVAAGTYKPGGNANTDRLVSFVMKTGVAIYGGFVGNEGSLNQRAAINPVSGPGGASQPSSSTLSGEIGSTNTTDDNSYNVVRNNGGSIDSTAVLDGFVVTGGNANGSDNNWGGGMINVRTSPTVRNCSFLNNSAASGGGIYNFSANASLTNCSFQGNTASGSGGGMSNEGNSPRLTNCSFQGNTATNFGGGMYNINSSNPILTNCAFQGNAVSTEGGGMYNYNSSNARLINCSFQSNTTSSLGGGMANNASSPTLTNCSFLNNTATTLGGGMYNQRSSGPSLTNCSFQANTANGGGGGMFNTSGSNPSLTNCMLFGNGGSSAFDNRGNGAVTLRYSLIEATVTNFADGGNNIRTSVFPFLSTTSTQLNGCSPAINTGLSSASGLSGITTDLAGSSRVFGGQIDMGSYEFQAAPNLGPTITNPSITTATQGRPFTVSFSASGGTSPYEYRVAVGTLPTGLTLNQTTGVLSGTPTQAGSYSIAVEGRDRSSCSGLSNTYTLVVNAILPTISGLAASSASVCVGSPVTFTATVGNVSGTYEYTLTNGVSAISGTSSTTTFRQTLTATIDEGRNYTLVVSADGQNGWAETGLTVSRQPTFAISYPASKYCRNNDNIISPNISFSPGFFPSNGSYSSSPTGLSLDAASGQVRTGLSSPNAYTISYTYPPTGGCPATTTTTSLTIVGAPGFVNLSRIQPTCATPTGTISVTYTGSGPLEYSINNGATWQASNVFSGLAPGQTYTISVRSQSEPDCISTTSATIVSLQNTVNIRYPAGPYCRNVSTAYPASVTSTGGPGTFSSSPAGLSIDVAGTIYPNQSEPGSYTVSYVSSTCTNVTATAAVTIVGSLVIGLDITQPTCAMTTGTINASVSGLSGVEYNLNGGSWQPSGLFSGLAAGQSYTVQARLANSPVCESSISGIIINAVPSPPSVSNPVITTATVGVAFNQRFSALGGTGEASFDLASGTLPTGLTLTSAGVLTGTPSRLGSFPITVRATNANGCSGVSATYTLSVDEPFSPIRYVKQGGAGNGSGNSWANASGDLQSQIDLAGVTQVWVAAGTYKPGGDTNTDRTVSFVMKSGVAIYGGFAGSETALNQRPAVNPVSGPGGASQPSSSTLSGEIGSASTDDNSYHVVNNDQTGIDNTAVLDGFVIRGGSANKDGGSNTNAGGGMLNVLTSPTVRNCSFLTNSASYLGGGIYNYSANPNLTNCSFQANSTSTSGGGVCNDGNSNPSLTNCSFQSNTANFGGGGMYNSSSDPSLTNCSFQGNTASSRGGGIYNETSSNPSLTNCSFQGNTANRGGAMLNFSNSNASLTNCVLFGNGGANTLFTFGPGTVTLRYSLIESTVTGYTDGGNNLTTTVSPFVSTTSTLLNGCAPAINTGSSQAYSGPATDLAGNPRVFGSTIDMGAYEYQATPNPGLTLTTPSITTATVGSVFAGSFTVSGGMSPYSFSLASGNLPTGLTLTAGGALSGTPSQTGNFPITVRAIDNLGCSGVSATYTLTVNESFSPIRYVKQGGAGTGSGNSWADASADLQSQIDLTGVTQVWVAAGTYKPGGDANTDPSVSFSMKNGVTIYGGFAATGSPTLAARNPTSFTTVLSGDIGTADDNADNSYHVINNTSLNATAVLDGFVISGGNAIGYDSFDYGGGMNNDDSSPTLVNCLFLNNSALYGGGMSNANASSPTLTNCQFGNNSADEGAGMYTINSSNPSLTNCVFRSNSASAGGGGINNVSSSPSLISCLFQDNSSGFYGGAMNNNSSNPSLVNCSFQGNSGGFSGGGMYNSSSDPSLTNCSFQANTASQGGALYNDGNSVLINCVLFGNGGANTLAGSAVTLRYSLIESTVRNYTDGVNNLTTTVSPFVSTTSTLLNGCAAAINTGSNQAYSGPATDLAGNPRVFGSTIDMGAYEYQAAPNPGLTLTNPSITTATVGSVFAGSFSATGGMSPYSFSVASGNLPTGLTLTAGGALSGTPSQTGSFPITVRAQDANGCSGVSATYTLVIINATPTLVGLAPSSEVVCIGSPVTFTASVGNITDNYSYTLTNGNSPLTGTSSGAIFSQQVTSSGTGLQSFTLIVSANGQSATLTTNVTVSPLPVASLVSSGSLTCSVTSVTLTAGGGQNYSFGGPGIVSQSGNTAVVNASGTYSVTVTSANGCTATATTTVLSDNTAPVASILTPTSTTLTCATPTLSLTATGGGTYRWDDNTTTATRTVNVSSVYSVTVTSANGCSSVASTTVSQDNTAPVASLVSSGSLTCSVTSVTLTAGGGQSYSFGGPGIVSQSGNTAVINASGTYSVTVTSTNGCSSIASTTVSQDNTAPVASILTPTSTMLTCATPTLSLTATGGGTTYRWDDNTTTATRTVNTAGVYSVTVTSANGCSSIASTTVLSDNTAPVASLVSSGSLTCSVNSVTLTASPGGQSYSFGGPGVVSQNGNIAVVNVAGTYSVTVIFANGCAATATMTVESSTTAPVASILTPASTTLSCATPTLSLTATGGDTYRWDDNTTTAIRTVSTEGVYSVTVTSANGCSSVASTTVLSDNTAPVASLVSSGSLTCSVSSVTLTASPGGQSYSFSGPGIVSQSGNTAVVNAAGVYSVTVTSANGCTATATTTVLSDNTAPVASLVSSGSLTCSVNSVTLTASPGGQSYSFGGPGVVSQSGNTAVVNAAGVYSLTVTSANGCSSVASTTVSQDANLPSVSISPSSATLTCANPTATLIANGTGSVRWSTGSTENQISVSASGTYSVTLTSTNGCTASAGVTVTADQTAPQVSIISSSTVLTCTNPFVTLTAVGTGSVRWSTGSTDTQISVSTAGSYSVVLTSPGGCTALASVTIGADQTAPQVSITASSTILTCANPTATLTAVGTGSIRWSTGSTENQINVSLASTYSVTLTSPGGCTASASVTINTDQTAPQVSITASNTVLTCASPSTTLTAVGTGSVRWNTGSTENQISVSSSGTYSVTLTSPTGCTAIASVQISQNNSPVVVNITAIPSQTLTTGQSVTLTASGAIDYHWNTGENTPSIVVNTAATYSVTGTIGLCSGQASATVFPASQPNAPFAITAVTAISCSPITASKFSVSFAPRYSGLNGQPLSFSVVNELLPTYEPGPYNLQLYTDNPVITLKASQQGTVGEASFSYNWLEACRTSEAPNTPPQVVTPLSDQTATVGQGYSYVIPAGTFTDNETPLNLQLSAQGLPPGLAFIGSTISGVPSTSVGSPFLVTITATDPGGLWVSSQFRLTVLPGSQPVEPSTPFAITGVSTISCTPVANRLTISFNPQYAGVNGQAISFEVINELVSTTNPGPYSLTLYRDNPVIQLRAQQTGSAEIASFSYNWLAACQNLGQENTPPHVNSPVGNQTAVVGQAFSLNLANTFIDQETPDQISLSASGLPDGLSLVGKTISGVGSMSGVSLVSVTATDGGGLSTSTSFMLTISPATSQTVSPGEGFVITGVQTLSCVRVSAGLRSVVFQPLYSGVNGQPIHFSVVNEMAPTTDAGPYTLLLYTDNPVITLKSAQQGSPGEASYVYSWLTACPSGARAATTESVTGLQVRVLGNPIEGNVLEVEIRGVETQQVNVEIVDLQGRPLNSHRIDQASVIEQVKLVVDSLPGQFILQVRTASERQVIKLLKP